MIYLLPDEFTPVLISPRAMSWKWFLFVLNSEFCLRLYLRECRRFISHTPAQVGETNDYSWEKDEYISVNTVWLFIRHTKPPGS